MSKQSINYLPASELVIHPTATLPPLADDSSEFLAILSHARSSGELPEPLRVSKHRVIGGADGLRAARLLGIDEVATIEVPETEVTSALMAALCARPHYTKGQRAYLAYPFMEPLIEESKARRAANLLKGTTKPSIVPDSAISAESGKRVDSSDSASSADSGKRVFMPVYQFTGTMEDAAEKLGISVRLLQTARDIHKLFADPEKGERLRNEFEPRILATDENGAVSGLGALLAGITSSASTKGGTVERHDPALVWSNRISKIFPDNRFAGWERSPEEVRIAAAKQFTDDLLLKAPKEIIDTVTATLTERATPKLKSVA